MKKRYALLTLLFIVICLSSCKLTDMPWNVLDKKADLQDSGDTENSSEDEKEEEASSQEHEEKKADYRIATRTEYVFEESEYYDTTLSSMQYPIISYKGDYNSVLEETIGNINFDEKQYAINTQQYYLQEAEERCAKHPNNFHYDEFITTAKVHRADTNVLSLYFSSSYTFGYSTEYTRAHSSNYDIHSGKKLGIKDVVKDMPTFLGVLNEKLQNYSEGLTLRIAGEEDYKEDYSEKLQEIFSEENINKVCWTLDYYGVSVYFNPREIDDKNSMKTITIFWDDQKDLFNPYYISSNDSYGIQLDLHTPFLYDVDNCGHAEKIELSSHEGQYGSYEYLYIEIGNQTYGTEVEAYSLRPTFLHCPDGNFLYVETEYDDMYRQIMVLDLNDDEDSFQKTQQFHQIFEGYETMSDEVDLGRIFEVAIADPNDFMLSSSTYCLCSGSISRNYHIGEDGVPRTNANAYTRNDPVTLTLKQNLEVTTVERDEYGNFSDGNGTKTLRAGCVVEYIATDNKQYAYLQLDNGKYVRVELDEGDWVHTINGVDVQDIFDGVYFAG